MTLSLYWEPLQKSLKAGQSLARQKYPSDWDVAKQENADTFWTDY